MNCDTGEFKNLIEGEEIQRPWREWSVDELVEVKGGLFQVVGIDVKANRVVLEGRNKQARKPLGVLFDKFANAQKTPEYQGVHDKMMKSFVNDKND